MSNFFFFFLLGLDRRSEFTRVRVSTGPINMVSAPLRWYRRTNRRETVSSNIFSCWIIRKLDRFDLRIECRSPFTILYSTFFPKRVHSFVIPVRSHIYPSFVLPPQKPLFLSYPHASWSAPNLRSSGPEQRRPSQRLQSTLFLVKQ